MWWVLLQPRTPSEERVGVAARTRMFDTASRKADVKVDKIGHVATRAVYLVAAAFNLECVWARVFSFPSRLSRFRDLSRFVGSKLSYVRPV